MIDNQFFDLVVGQELPNRAPGLTKEMVQRITHLNQAVAASGSCRCVVVAFPADQDPDLPFSIG